MAKVPAETYRDVKGMGIVMLRLKMKYLCEVKRICYVHSDIVTALGVRFKIAGKDEAEDDADVLWLIESEFMRGLCLSPSAMASHFLSSRNRGEDSIDCSKYYISTFILPDIQIKEDTRAGRRQ